jgi:RND family efflux transporter MFP subunit
MKPTAPNKLGFSLILAAVALIAFLFLFGWLPRLSNTREIDALAAEDPLPRVTTMQIKPNTKPITLVLPSSAQAWHITPIWARVNGYLVRYLVDIGDVVSQGDLLAEIDTPETDEQVGQAKADLFNSLAERDIAKITNDRWQRLWNKNREAVSKQEVDQYLANYRSAEAIVQANEKNVSRLIYQQYFKYIYAPFDGIITQRNVDIGSLIYGSVNGTPQELFQIAQTHVIRFFVDVPQTYFRHIIEDLEAEVTVQELPGKIFKGKVSRYAKALDPTARTLLTEVDVENPDGSLYAGLFGQVKFLMRPETINFIIPTTALIIRAGLPHVAIVDDKNIIRLKQVEIGLDYGKQVEITAGLQDNDQIVTIPTDEIYEGTKVQIVTQNPNASDKKV